MSPDPKPNSVHHKDLPTPPRWVSLLIFTIGACVLFDGALLLLSGNAFGLFPLLISLPSVITGWQGLQHPSRDSNTPSDHRWD